MRAPMMDFHSATASDLGFDDIVRRMPNAMAVNGDGHSDHGCADLEGAFDADILAYPADVPAWPILADQILRSSARPTENIAYKALDLMRRPTAAALSESMQPTGPVIVIGPARTPAPRSCRRTAVSAGDAE